MNGEALVDRAILCLVIDRRSSSLPIAEAVEGAVRGGVDWLQIRERDLPAAALLAFAQKMRDAAARGAPARRVPILMNRRIDVALALPARGVHLGFDALDPRGARALLPRGAWIGVSAHGPDEVKHAADAGVDYVHLAPIATPLSKAATRAPLGVGAVRLAAAHGVAVLAQGGVEAKHCSDLRRAGARGIAVTGSILMSPRPEHAAAELREALDAHVSS